MASLDNAVSGSTTGSLSLNETATGGAGGGWFQTNAGGAGGNASSLLGITNGSAASVSASTSATGGSGGVGISGGAAGTAVAAMMVTATAGSANANSAAFGGMGGWAANGSGAMGAGASATSNAVGAGSNAVSSTANAGGGEGGFGTGIGNKDGVGAVADGVRDRQFERRGNCHRDGLRRGRTRRSGGLVDGGAGASQSLTNAVSGSTTGALSLLQGAVGVAKAATRSQEQAAPWRKRRLDA